MLDRLISYLKDKNILILGFGREGKSTYKFIRKYFPSQKITISDQNDMSDEVKSDNNVSIIYGDHYLDGLDKYDIIMKSPGIVLKDIDVSSFRSKIKSELELLLEFFPVRTIGITGTKGKSTTSSLIYQILKDQGKDTLLLGNIGTPVFDYIEDFKDDMYLVLEMSSHQLEFMDVSPNISILLNIFEEHLDHYNSFEDYAKAKCNIFLHQKKDDYFLYNTDFDLINKFAQKAKSNKFAVSFKPTEKHETHQITIDKNGEVYFENEPVYNKSEKRELIGDFIVNNLMFVLGVCKILNLDIDKARETISKFKSLPHRLEKVGTVNGVTYYDNSIATIPEATIQAVKALGHVDTLIIGGMDRGIDYSGFIKYLNDSNITNIICMPKTGHDIAKSLPIEKKYVVDTMEVAVKVAKKITPKGGICLLSPAAASYGFFKNFEEKGDIYKSLVLG